MIPGYTSEAELGVIHLAAILTAGLPGDIVEIGSWCGRSSVVLADAAYNSKVHCVDLFLDKDDWKQRPDGNWESETRLPNGQLHRSHNNPPISTSVFNNEVLPVYNDHPILLDYFKENIRNNHFEDIVVSHKGTSTTWASAQPADFKCRLAFIDGGHSYEEVIEDIQNVEKFLLPNSWILFDDVGVDFPGVDKAVKERIIDTGSYDNIRHTVGRLLMARRK